MAIKATHELHHRRFGRNLGVSLALLAFVAVVFGLTIAKIGVQGPTEGFDHMVRPEMAEKAAG
ncbi:MAG: hypothetical protein ACPGNV_00575 [Mangrovicoccus sp.]